MDLIKVKTSEINGEELEFESEVLLDVSNISNTGENFDPNEGQSLTELLDWVRNNANVSFQRVISDSLITVNQNIVKQFHSPMFDGELFIDGEVYIL